MIVMMAGVHDAACFFGSKSLLFPSFLQRHRSQSIDTYMGKAQSSLSFGVTVKITATAEVDIS